MPSPTITAHPLFVAIVSIVAAAVLGGVVWLVRNAGDNRAILVGVDGQNGLRGDLRQMRRDLEQLRDARHQHGDSLHTIHGEMALLKQHVNTLERETREGIGRLSSDVERLREDLGS